MIAGSHALWFYECDCVPNLWFNLIETFELWHGSWLQAYCFRLPSAGTPKNPIQTIPRTRSAALMTTDYQTARWWLVLTVALGCRLSCCVVFATKPTNQQDKFKHWALDTGQRKWHLSLTVVKCEIAKVLTQRHNRHCSLFTVHVSLCTWCYTAIPLFQWFSFPTSHVMPKWCG